MRRELSDADAAYAESALDEIGAYLSQLVEVDPTDEVQASNLKYASLSMASRLVADATAGPDVSAHTQGAGSYTETVTYATPFRTGNLWKLLRSSGYAARLGVGLGLGHARPSYGRLERGDD